MPDQVLLQSGAFEGLREAGSIGRPLHTLYPQLKAVIETELDQTAALLFAEPVVDEQRRCIDWYTQGVDKPTALNDLQESERDSSYAQLIATYDRLQALADRYIGSDDSDRKRLGSTLQTALAPPTAANVFVVDKHPVITYWGFIPDSSWGAPIDLPRLRGRLNAQSTPESSAVPDIETPPAMQPPPIPPERPESSGVSEPSLPVAASVGESEEPVSTSKKPISLVGSKLFWGLVVFALLLLILAAILNYFDKSPSPAEGTVVGRTTPADLAETTEGPKSTGYEAIKPLPESQGTFAEGLDSGLSKADITPKPSVGTPSDSTALPTPSIPKPGGVSSAMEAVPEPTAEERQEFADRLATEGGEIGEITITLLWDNRNDLDLVVICPNGERLYYNSPRVCGGALDVDRNAGKQSTSRPVENIHWPQGQAAAGTYQVAVKYYARKDSDSPSATPFQIRLLKNGQEQIFKGVIAPGELKPVTAFEVER